MGGAAQVWAPLPQVRRVNDAACQRVRSLSPEVDTGWDPHRALTCQNLGWSPEESVAAPPSPTAPGSRGAGPQQARVQGGGARAGWLGCALPTWLVPGGTWRSLPRPHPHQEPRPPCDPSEGSVLSQSRDSQRSGKLRVGTHVCQTGTLAEGRGVAGPSVSAG